MIVKNHESIQRRQTFWDTDISQHIRYDTTPVFDLEKALERFKGGKSRDMIHSRKRRWK